MQQLLLVNLGPVQEFISSARRSRDLWFGSWLLSELSKATARYIVEQFGFDALIFPAPGSENDLRANSEFNVTNRILALIDQSPVDIDDEVRQAIQKQLQVILPPDQQIQMLLGTKHQRRHLRRRVSLN